MNYKMPLSYKVVVSNIIIEKCDCKLFERFVPSNSLDSLQNISDASFTSILLLFISYYPPAYKYKILQTLNNLNNLFNKANILL